MPFYFAFHHFFFPTRRLSSSEENVCRTARPGTLYSDASALSGSRLTGKLFLFDSVSSADRRMQLDLCETILKKTNVAFFSRNVVVFISVKMHGICYCTKIEEVNM